MIIRIGTILALLGTSTFAQLPSPPPPKNPILQDRPRQPSAWERIQDPIDRSTGRIVDDQTYQVERMQRWQDERYGRIVPQPEFQRFQEERERYLRIEQRQGQQQVDLDRARREELDRREMELYMRGGYSATSLQVMEDGRALNAAKARRDEQLIAAQNERAESVRAQPDNRAPIDAAFQQKTNLIRQDYERERGRILGLDPAPATQPAG